MNDDDLGHALATALVAPDVQAAPDAGAKLRARARRQRSQSWALGGTIAAMLAVLVAVGVVRVPPSNPPAGPSGVSYGHSLLRVPLAVYLNAACPTGSQCGLLPVLTLDEVLGLRVVGPPQGGAVVEVTLTGDDERTLARTPLPQQAVLVAVAGSRSSWARFEANTLRIMLPTHRFADGLVSLLAPYRPVARTGPGRLDRSLQVWWVLSSRRQPCTLAAAGPHRLAVNRLGECMLLAGPAVTIDAANVRIVAPPAGVVGAEWIVDVLPSSPARQTLAEWTARHPGQRVVLGIDGQLVGRAPELVGGSSSLEIAVADRGYAEAVVSRMRP